MFNNINDTLDYIYNQKKASKRENLNRIENAVKLLNIKIDYKIIHIAGTNGKGSTAEMTKSILANTNKHVGIFVSPFIVSFNDRIRINDRYISDAEIMHYGNILYEFNEEYKLKYNDVIPFFELTLLMALMWFSDRNIDIAVIECGLGGLLDATNFLKCDIGIITNVGFDHMEQLGNTLDSIANHKLGIIKNNMTCLTCVDDELKNKFINYCNDNNSNIIFTKDYLSNIEVTDSYTSFKYKNISYKTSLIGKYQAYNASLAIEASRIIDSTINDDLINFSLTNIKWPGRFEILSNNPKIIIDGAHNIHAIKNLCETLKVYKKDYKLKILFSALRDKDYKPMLNELSSITDYFYFTTMPDLRKEDPYKFTNLTNIENEVVIDYKDAFSKAVDNIKENEILLVTGSLHFISMIREYFFSKK